MKFTFKKYLNKIIMIYSMIILVLLLISLYFLFENHFVGLTIILFVIPFVLNCYDYCDSVKKFVRKNSPEELEKLEKDLTNALLKYNNWFLTEEYIFNIEYQLIIHYDEIVLIEPSWAFIKSHRGGYTIGQKQVLHLKNGNEYVIKAQLLDGDFDMFTDIVKQKNHSVFIGNEKDFNKI